MDDALPLQKFQYFGVWKFILYMLGEIISIAPSTMETFALKETTTLGRMICLSADLVEPRMRLLQSETNGSRICLRGTKSLHFHRCARASAPPIRPLLRPTDYTIGDVQPNQCFPIDSLNKIQKPQAVPQEFHHQSEALK